MAVLFALTGALAYGIADFWGGLATKRTAVTAVVALSQAAGLAVLVPVLLVLPARPDLPSLAWGAAAGLVGGLGLLLFYRSLATGTMSVVAPLTAVCAAAVPVVFGLTLGERPAPLALMGVAVALAAVLLISSEGGRLPTWRQLLEDRATVGALAAGFAFGLFFVLISRSADDSGLWPLASARVASLVLLGVVALVSGRSLVPARPAMPLVLAAGIGDMAANVLFLLASREGLLSVTGVLIALYPASTVLLAQVVLRERLGGPQLVGMGAAAVAVSLIAVG